MSAATGAAHSCQDSIWEPFYCASGLPEMPEISYFIGLMTLASIRPR